MNSDTHPGNFEMLSRLNELNLCRLFFKLSDDLTKTISLFKKVHISPAHLAVKAFESYEGGCHYFWVVRVGGFYLVVEFHWGGCATDEATPSCFGASVKSCFS